MRIQNSKQVFQYKFGNKINKIKDILKCRDEVISQSKELLISFLNFCIFQQKGQEKNRKRLFMIQKKSQQCRKLTKYFRRNEYINKPSINFFSMIFTCMILIIYLPTGKSGRVKTPYGWDAQTGVVTFTITSPDTYTDARFGSVYSLTLQVLQLEGQQYSIILGLGKVDTRFSPTTSAIPLMQATAHPWADSSVSSIFAIQFFIQEQTLLTSVKANYLLIGANLLSNSLMMGSSIILNLGLGRCDGLAAPITCSYVRGVHYFSTHMDMTKYKVFLSVSGFSLFSDSTTTVTPFTSTGVHSKFEIKYTNFVSTASNVITVQVTVDRVSMSLVTFYVIAAHVDMFNPTLKKSTVLIEYSKIMTTSGIQHKNFAQKVFKNNYFMGLNGFKGPKWAFDVYHLNPADEILRFKLFDSSSYLHVHGFVMYGFTDECKTRRSCRACYEPPNFECTQCQKNFLVTSPPNSICRCPRPYQEVSGICDLVPFGCIVAKRLPDDSIICHQCNVAKKLVINSLTNSCECIPKFEMGDGNVCREICGDGFRVVTQCDDGNTVAGDGCSPTCSLERGFICNILEEPTTCTSSASLIYQIESIIKIQDSNSAIIKLKLKNQFNYPFPVYKQQFLPVQDFIKLQSVLTLSPYNEINITDLQLVEVNQQKILKIIFHFNVSLQNTKAKLHLNYKQTFYLDYIQTIYFELKGANKPLKFSDTISSFQDIGSGMLIGAIVSMVLLVIGLITPKFIGLETIVTMQLIFFSQILIYDNSKFPVGFLLLSNLQYTTGFNDIVEFSEYIPMTDYSRKMFTLIRDKLIIQNFNINFGILFVCFMTLLITCLIRKLNEEKILESRGMTNDEGNENKIKQKEQPLQFNPRMRKANEIAFYISNQIAFWLILPFISAISAALCIENFTLVMIDQSHFIISKGDEIIALCSALMIYGIIMSNFGNMWLSNISMRDINERPQELKYKHQFFVYLNIVGMYIFFMNDMDSDGIYCSAVVLFIQVIHMIYLYYLNPYKKSLTIHFVGMMFNNFLYLAFLVIINIINYSEDVQNDVILGLGYTIIVFCVIFVLITFVRLYYELKYGKELEEKLRQERLNAQLQELMRQQLEKNKLKYQIENQARSKLSERQKIRDQNVYLYENQLKQDQKISLMGWLQGRQLLDQKAKDAHYFKHFTQKPLDWLFKYDKEKYDVKVKEMNEHIENNKQKRTEKQADKDHQTIVSRLKRWFLEMKSDDLEKLEKHQKKMHNDNSYAMSIMKQEQQKLFQKSYSIKNK